MMARTWKCSRRRGEMKRISSQTTDTPNHFTLFSSRLRPRIIREEGEDAILAQARLHLLIEP